MNSSMQDNKVVVVTGAGTGIGRATARMFSGMGAQVVAVGRRAEPLAETAAGYDGIRPLTADVAAEGAAEEIMRAVNGHPEEVAWAITRLASPQASFVTGVVLPVDGGAVVA